MSIARYRAATSGSQWQKVEFTAPAPEEEDKSVSGKLKKVKIALEKVIENDHTVKGVLSASARKSNIEDSNSGSESSLTEEGLRERMRSEAESLRKIYEGSEKNSTPTLLGQIRGRN